ncbi:hypothetical protein B0H16DRAFT_1453108 [Mycena metata]|uniref:Uncharacterized protein n=1 Tax=Mycena metata TaxID=1033252 RepID=A0AAD7JN81_9AGAR|nr:hypothetical protein B0H16DRAFT_1453108 [Mycena metata]
MYSPFSDMPSSSSEEIAPHVAGPVHAAYEKARQKYYNGEDGPYVLDGKWTRAEAEAFLDTFEDKWCVEWDGTKITLFGDPGLTHQSVGQCLSTWVSNMGWQTYPDTPAVLRNPLGLRRLFQDSRSSRFKWKLTPKSPSLYMKEPDVYFRATRAVGENGMAIEIAHRNETFDELMREILNWTRGEGERALLAVGLKIDSKSPHRVRELFMHPRDPRLRLVVRDVTPTSQCTSCRIYEFGAESGIEPRELPTEGPATAVQVKEVPTLLEGNMQVMVPVDKTDGTLMVEIPVGAAMFHNIQPDSISGILLPSNYITDIKRKVGQPPRCAAFCLWGSDIMIWNKWNLGRTYSRPSTRRFGRLSSRFGHSNLTAGLALVELQPWELEIRSCTAFPKQTTTNAEQRSEAPTPHRWATVCTSDCVASACGAQPVPCCCVLDCLGNRTTNYTGAVPQSLWPQIENRRRIQKRSGKTDNKLQTSEYSCLRDAQAGIVSMSDE